MNKKIKLATELISKAVDEIVIINEDKSVKINFKKLDDIFDILDLKDRARREMIKSISSLVKSGDLIENNQILKVA